jgi:hypothetical protein
MSKRPAKIRKSVVAWLQEEVRDPVENWLKCRIKPLPWFLKVILLICLVQLGSIGVFVGKYPKEAKAYAATIKYYWVAFWKPGKPIPMSKREHQELRLEINSLIRMLKTKAVDTLDMNAWSIGQVMTSLPDTNGVDVSILILEAQKYLIGRGKGYRQFTNDDFAQIHISAWLAYGLAFIDRPIDVDDLNFILGNQDRQSSNSGWWPVCPCLVRQDGNASTYTTAWAVLALNEQLKKGMIPADHTDAARASINSAELWLKGTRIPGKTRWYDYPYRVRMGERTESLSASALVLHTLHVLDPHNERSDFQELDSGWIRNLPTEVPSPPYKEVAGVDVEIVPRVYRRDGIRQYVLPWEIIATVDGYRNANLIERARALRWIDEMINRLPAADLSLQGAYWIAAELLISLQYLESGPNK